MKFKEGKKLTTFEISSFMANTIKREITIKGEHNGEPIFALRGKRKKFYFKPGNDTFIFAGWDLPVITDGERPAVNGITSFSGNACFNLASRNNAQGLEEVKKYIEENQLNEELTEKAKASILFVDKGGKKIVMYPELDHQNHAIIDRAKQNGNQDI